MTNKEKFIGEDSIDMANNLIRFANSTSCPCWENCMWSKKGNCYQLKNLKCTVEIARWLDSVPPYNTNK